MQADVIMCFEVAQDQKCAQLSSKQWVMLRIRGHDPEEACGIEIQEQMLRSALARVTAMQLMLSTVIPYPLPPLKKGDMDFDHIQCRGLGGGQATNAEAPLLQSLGFITVQTEMHLSSANI